MKEPSTFGRMILGTAAIVSCLSCGSAVPRVDSGHAADTMKNDISVAASANQFCMDLYGRLGRKHENIFFSPYSIWTALAMTQEGARGETAEEMRQVLHAPDDPELRRAAIKGLLTVINDPAAPYELSTANALWAQRDHAFLREYMDVVKGFYAARVANLDFVSDAEGSRKTINDWVADETRQRIKDLIPQGALTAMTRLVLTNAIYFKGAWLERFEEAQTTEQPFLTGAGDTVSVPMMVMTEARVRYAETPEAQVIELPYTGDSLAMLLVLPRMRELRPLEAPLDTARLRAWTDGLVFQKVDIFIPRFKLETKYNLNGDLGDMGMELAFSPQADFSGMDGKGELFISTVIHQAFVEVNEEGTEAAAATGVMMETVSARPRIEFRADHPFVFMILDKRTGAILFMGRLSDPRQGT